MRFILRLFVALVALVVIAVGALMFLPKERIAAIVSDQVRAQTGRELAIAEGVSLAFWPVLGVETGPVRLANADWAGPEPMLEARGLSIGLEAAALLSGTIRIKHVVLDMPVIRLATRSDGMANWDLAAASDEGAQSSETAASAGGMPAGVSLEKLTLSDGRLLFSPEDGERIDLRNINVDISLPEADGAARITGRLTPFTETVEIEAEIGRMAALLAGDVVPVTAAIETAGSAVRFDGRASIAGDVAGRLSLTSPDTAALARAGGVLDLEMPRGLGRAASVEAEVTYTSDGRLALRDMVVGLDDNRLQGAADITVADPLEITAQLRAGALDLSVLTDSGGTGDTAGSGTAGATGWPTDPIDASALAMVNGSISFTADSIDTGMMRLGPTDALVTIDRARAVLELRRATVFDGSVTGQLVANNRNGLSVGGNLRAVEIDMQKFLTDMAEIDRLTGKAEANIEFLGSGNTMDAIMKSLSGKGGLSMGRGVILGIDLDRLMRSGDASGGTTVFDDLSATYTITAGQLLNEDLQLLLSNFRAEGAGRIGIGPQDMDYTFTPIALRANSGKGLAIPVRITGPWASPRIIPDLGAAFDVDVDGKIEEAKQDARQKVEQKVIEELNIAPQEGQSVEDAVKDKLEDEAKRGLLKLLGQD